MDFGAFGTGPSVTRWNDCLPENTGGHGLESDNSGVPQLGSWKNIWRQD